MESTQAVTALSALAQKSRLAVFRWLVQKGPQGDLPSAMAEQLSLAPATLSFHLKALQQAQLIAAKQSGRYICYTANFTVMQALLDYLTENCCAGDLVDCELGSTCCVTPPDFVS
jgi:ArsR family transcriptional regulator, arsenate/arsenite/antimonite-responsive transcriptional repressor